MPLTPSNSVKETPVRNALKSTKSASSSPKRRVSTEQKQFTTITPVSPLSKNRAVTLRSSNVDLDRKKSVNIDTKENVDLALEINITTGPNVQVY